MVGWLDEKAGFINGRQEGLLEFGLRCIPSSSWSSSSRKKSGKRKLWRKLAAARGERATCRCCYYSCSCRLYLLAGETLARTTNKTASGADVLMVQLHEVALWSPLGAELRALG